MNQVLTILMIIAIFLVGFTAIFFTRFYIHIFASRALDKKLSKDSFFKNWNLKKELLIWIITIGIGIVLYIIFLFTK